MWLSLIKELCINSASAEGNNKFIFVSEIFDIRTLNCVSFSIYVQQSLFSLFSCFESLITQRDRGRNSVEKFQISHHGIKANPKKKKFRNNMSGCRLNQCLDRR